MERDAQGLIIRPVRRDSLSDAAGVAAVLNGVIAQKHLTALVGPWTPQAELGFLQGLGRRSELLVAEIDGQIVGFQVIEPFATYTSSMDHVAHFGTYVQSEMRGRGIGKCLAAASMEFLRAHGYEKVVIYVLSGNEAGQAYYRSLGFEALGVLKRHTKIDGVYHDEVFMELHLQPWTVQSSLAPV